MQTKTIFWQANFWGWEEQALHTTYKIKVSNIKANGNFLNGISLQFSNISLISGQIRVSCQIPQIFPVFYPDKTTYHIHRSHAAYEIGDGSMINRCVGE